MDTHKLCQCCKETKPIADFGKDKHTSDGLRCYCLICSREKTKNSHHTNSDKRKVYRRKWESENRDRLNQTSNAYRKNRRLSIKKILVKELGGKCWKCGYDFSVAALDFHHLDPTKKEHSIGELICQYSLETARKEIEGCALLCCRCHRELHAGDISLEPLLYH